MAKNTNAGADQAPATLEEAVALAKSYKDKLATVEKEAEDNSKSSKKSLDESADKLEKANAVIESQAAELKDAHAVIEELKAELAEAGKGKKKGPVVTIGNKTYLVTGGTMIKKKPYSPADIAADKELCKKLIAKGSTLLKETK